MSTAVIPSTSSSLDTIIWSLPILFLLKPLTTESSHLALLRSPCISLPRTNSLFTGLIVRCNAQSPAHWKDSPILSTSRAIIEWECSVAFSAPNSLLKWCINEPCPDISSAPPYRNPYDAISVSWERCVSATWKSSPPIPETRLNSKYNISECGMNKMSSKSKEAIKFCFFFLVFEVQNKMTFSLPWSIYSDMCQATGLLQTSPMWHTLELS